MTTTHRWIARTLAPIALAGACASLAPACSDDSNGGPAADGGPEASNGAGGKASGGSAGKAGASGSGTGGRAGSSAGGAAGGSGTGGVKPSSGGARNDASVPDAGAGDASVPEDGGPGPDDVLCSGDAGTTASPLLVAGIFCDNCTTSEVAAVDLGRGCVLGRSAYDDTDIVPRASGGHGFLLERGNGMLNVLDTDAHVTARVDLHTRDSGSDKPNPNDVVYAPSVGGPAKAYVSLYDEGKIAIVDLDGAAHSVSFVDLSSFADPSDTDGSPDPATGFFDPQKGRAYFVMQRTDVNTAKSDPFVIHCPPPSAPSLLVAVDVTTDQLVDLNGAATGVALPLSLVAPADVALDLSGRRAYLLDNGCGKPDGTDGGLARTLGGVESVDLDTLATAVAFTPATGDFFSRIQLFGHSTALLQSFDANFSTLWNRWDTASPTLGPTLTGVPDAAVFETAGTLVGVMSHNGRPEVARYELSTQTATRVVAAPWTHDYTFTAGAALVK
jgi:hypothetical protein